jgi:outer membrane lipoprotein LolB
VQSEQHDQYNHLIQLRQSGYTVEFTRYTSVKGVDLPSALRLEGYGVMVKVLIKNWNIKH